MSIAIIHGFEDNATLSITPYTDEIRHVFPSLQ